MNFLATQPKSKVLIRLLNTCSPARMTSTLRKRLRVVESRMAPDAEAFTGLLPQFGVHVHLDAQGLPYFSVNRAALTKASLLAISLLTYASNCSGLMSIGSAPTEAIRAFTSGACTALLTSV